MIIREGFFIAKFGRLGARYGLPTMASEIGTGKPVKVYKTEDFDAADHDRKLLGELLIGADSAHAVQIFDQVRSSLKSGLRTATEEDITDAFSS